MVSTSQRTGPSLAADLTGVVGSVTIVNGLIFGLGWTDEGRIEPRSSLAPPGWVVGSVWILLFALLAVARWKLRQSGQCCPRRWVTTLIVFCLAYPFYALGPGREALGFAGNLATICLAAFVVWRVRRTSSSAAWCVFPVIPWVIFATFTILADWGWIGS